MCYSATGHNCFPGGLNPCGRFQRIAVSHSSQGGAVIHWVLNRSHAPRSADNLYWMTSTSRRAEHTAPLLDVNLNLMLDESSSALTALATSAAALGTPLDLAWRRGMLTRCSHFPDLRFHNRSVEPPLVLHLLARRLGSAARKSCSSNGSV